jgi:hypothetical protein
MSDVRAPTSRLGPAVVGVVTALLLALLLPREVPAQGLGDAAARERARRETRPKDPAKVFTDEDLPTTEDEEAADEEGEEGGDEEDETPELSKIGAADPLRAELDRRREERALQEREWRARFAEARAQVREAEARCWHEVVRTRFHNGIPVQMKVQEFVESEELRQAKRGLADLQEEFRRTGLPAGWARE